MDRGPRPEGFDDRAGQWAADFQADRNRNPQLTVSRFWTDIRNRIRQDAEALYEAFRGKCAFCESRMAHVSSPHIEHYRPKSLFPDLAFVWENWLLSCGRCNDKKWAHFPSCNEQPCVIDPTSEEPSNHIEFNGYLALGKTERGSETIRLVGLNRSPLEDERSRWLMSVNVLLLLCLSPEMKAEARSLLVWSMQSDAPYSAMTYSYLGQKAPRLANPDRPHPRVELHDPLSRIDQLLTEHSHSLQSLA